MKKTDPAVELTDIDKSLQEFANREEEKMIQKLWRETKPLCNKKFKRLPSIKEADESVEENETKAPSTTITKPSLLQKLTTLLIGKSRIIHPR